MSQTRENPIALPYCLTVWDGQRHPAEKESAVKIHTGPKTMKSNLIELFIMKISWIISGNFERVKS